MANLKIALLLAGVTCAAAAFAKEQSDGAYAVVQGPQGVVKAPLFSDKYSRLPIAKVADEVVTLRDLADLLAATHQAHKAPAARGAKKDFGPALDRLIGARLISLEAREMGLDEQPSFQQEMEQFAESDMVQMLKDRATAGVKADPREVEQLYRDAVREWKVQSVLFPKEEDAKAFAEAVKKGGKFSKLAADAIQAKKAQGTQKADWVSRKTAVAAVVQRLAALSKVGATTAPMRLTAGWAVVRIEAMRYPKDAAARAAAQSEAQTWALKRALKKYYGKLVDKYVIVDQELAARLDFEAKEPGFAALEKDERVLARIEGADPITVKELTGNLRTIFFHGVDRAIEEKKVNGKKFPALDSLISRRLMRAEARRQQLDKHPQHLRAVAEQRQTLLFGAYVQKAIAPDLKVADAEARKYYEDHKGDYTFATFYTLSTLAFRTQAAAQATADKLKAGADLKWVRANASDQVAASDGALSIDGTVSETSMPSDLARALAGAKAGEVRVCSVSADRHYVAIVKEVTPARPQPFEEVRSDIIALLEREKLNKAIDDIIARLRKVRPVQVYITQIAT